MYESLGRWHLIQCSCKKRGCGYVSKTKRDGINQFKFVFVFILLVSYSAYLQVLHSSKSQRLYPKNYPTRWITFGILHFRLLFFSSLLLIYFFPLWLQVGPFNSLPKNFNFFRKLAKSLITLPAIVIQIYTQPSFDPQSRVSDTPALRGGLCPAAGPR